MTASLKKVAKFFTGIITANDMTQEEIHQAIPLARKQLQDLIGADETPPRELVCMPEDYTVRH